MLLNTHRPIVIDYREPPQAEAEQVEPHPIEIAGEKLRDACARLGCIVTVGFTLWLIWPEAVTNYLRAPHPFLWTLFATLFAVGAVSAFYRRSWVVAGISALLALFEAAAAIASFASGSGQ